MLGAHWSAHARFYAAQVQLQGVGQLFVDVGHGVREAVGVAGAPAVYLPNTPAVDMFLGAGGPFGPLFAEAAQTPRQARNAHCYPVC